MVVLPTLGAVVRKPGVDDSQAGISSQRYAPAACAACTLGYGCPSGCSAHGQWLSPVRLFHETISSFSVTSGSPGCAPSRSGVNTASEPLVAGEILIDQS